MEKTEGSRYIYIMGRGHSGSTVLDSLLGNAPEAQGVGEMVAGLDGSYPCSCGREVRDCTMWGDVRDSFRQRETMSWDQAVATITTQARVQQYPKILLKPKTSGAMQEMARALKGVWRAVADVTGNTSLVDSSKEISRGLFLARSLPDARIIHIVRRPDRMLASNLHRLRDGSGLVLFRRTFDEERFAPLLLGMSAVSWVVGNLLCESVRALYPEKVLRLRYEDLCADPAGELRKIGRFTGLKLESVIESVQRREPLPIKHKLAGNRMARKQQFTFDPQRVSGRDLPDALEKVGRAITYPMLKAYGYE